MLLNCTCFCPTHQPQCLQKITLPWLITEKATHGEERKTWTQMWWPNQRKLDDGQEKKNELKSGGQKRGRQRGDRIETEKRKLLRGWKLVLLERETLQGLLVQEYMQFWSSEGHHSMIMLWKSRLFKDWEKTGKWHNNATNWLMISQLIKKKDHILLKEAHTPKTEIMRHLFLVEIRIWASFLAVWRGSQFKSHSS